MDTFRYNIIKIAVGTFTFFMCFCLYVFYVNSKTQNFPPYVSQCPDYWKYDSNAKKCYADGLNLGNDTKVKEINLTSYNFNKLNKNSLSSFKCFKKEWANRNNIQWSGISNYNADC